MMNDTKNITEPEAQGQAPEEAPEEAFVMPLVANPSQDRLKTFTYKTTNLKTKVTTLWEAEDAGLAGILVVKHSQKEDGTLVGTPEEPYYLPPVWGRYDNGEGITYIISDKSGLKKKTLDAVDSARPDQWRRFGNFARSELMHAKENKIIWHTFAESLPLTSQSPSILEGLPPLAPQSLVPQSQDEAGAREALALVASRLKPLGLFFLGCFVAAPWVGLYTEVSFSLHLNGRAGCGKSILGRQAAAFYGPSGAKLGLYHSFNTTPMGLMTLAQNLSYLPFVADEVLSSGGDVKKVFNTLIAGAMRAQATRSGNYKESSSQWQGIIGSTANGTLELTEEMYNRRSLEFMGHDLWEVPETVKQDPTKRNTWWQEVREAVRKSEGWVWKWLQDDYTPGTSKAHLPLEEFSRGDFPNYCEDEELSSLGQLGQAGLWGCRYLALKTGSRDFMPPALRPAVKDLLQKKQAQKVNLGRTAADKLLSSWDSQPTTWLLDEIDKKPPVVYGFSLPDKLRKCTMAHKGPCDWVACLVTPLETLTGVPLSDLLEDRDFVKACHQGSKGYRLQVWKKFPWEEARKQRRAVLVCRPGLSLLADSEESRPLEEGAEACGEPSWDDALLPPEDLASPGAFPEEVE